MPNTSLGFPQPAIGSNNWGVPLNAGFALLDQFLSGGKPIPALAITGNLSVGGTITAGAFAGLDGSFFLMSSLYNQPNGVPQLNSAGKIPSSLLTTQGTVVVPFAPTPVFDASQGQQFKMLMTGNVTSSTFANGAAGPSIVVMRIVQDGTGGRTFAWPPNFRNAGDVNPGPNARTVQAFAVDTDGSADAIGPVMYS